MVVTNIADLKEDTDEPVVVKPVDKFGNANDAAAMTFTVTLFKTPAKGVPGEGDRVSSTTTTYNSATKRHETTVRATVEGAYTTRVTAASDGTTTGDWAKSAATIMYFGGKAAATSSTKEPVPQGTIGPFVAGMPLTFKIQSRNDGGDKVDTAGADAYDTTTSAMYGGFIINGYKADNTDPNERDATKNYEFKWVTAGEYSIKLSLTKTGTTKLNVQLVDTTTGRKAHIKQSPFTVTITPGAIQWASCTATGPGLNDLEANNPGAFEVQLRDAFGNVNENATQSSSIVATYQKTGKDPSTNKEFTPSSIATGGGTGGKYTFSYTIAKAGAYQVKIVLGAGSADNVTITRPVNILAGDWSLAKTTVSELLDTTVCALAGSQADTSGTMPKDRVVPADTKACLVAGTTSSFAVQLRDAADNAVARNNDRDGVGAASLADRLSRHAEILGDVTVAARAPFGDSQHCIVNAMLKLGPGGGER